MALDNMSIRKKQLEDLDNFVKTLYDETQMTKKYGVDLPDLEMLYLHIHELIQELLQCQTSDEFMKMIQQLHQAIAGVLIVVAPGNAAQVKKDMAEAHGDDFEGQNFDDFLDNLQKTAVSKFGNNKKMKERTQKQPEEEVENDPEELVDMLDLKDHIKGSKAKKKEEAPVEDDVDPMEDVYKNF